MRYAFSDTVESIVELLVAHKYTHIEDLTAGVRLTANDIAEAVNRYGRELIASPRGAYEELDVMRVQGSAPARWSVRINLWTKEEGRSDLTLELTIIEADEGYKVELDDIHVL